VAFDHSFFARAWLAEHRLPENRVVVVEQATHGILWIETLGHYRLDGMLFREAIATNDAGLQIGVIDAHRSGIVFTLVSMGVLDVLIGRPTGTLIRGF
jgi:hypothetical protein